MQKFIQTISLVVFLILVATSCMAQAAALQDVDGDVHPLHHSISKRQNCDFSFPDCCSTCCSQVLQFNG
jgi:hypothetical protein